MEVVLPEISVGPNESVGLVLFGGDPHEDSGAVVAGLSETPRPVREGAFQFVGEDGAVAALGKLERRKEKGKFG